jgi:hypothetical protein
MSLDCVAVYSFTGMLTIPKLMTPFQIDLGMSLTLSRHLYPSLRQEMRKAGLPS